MKIILVRHGEADSVTPDFDRKLTGQGRKDIENLGSLIVSSGWKVRTVYHSPLVRTTETAEILGRLLDCNQQQTELLKPGLDPVHTIGGLELGAYDQSREAIILVFHMPDVAYLAGYLCSIPASNLFISPGTAIALNFNGPLRPGAGMLTWACPPEFLPKG